MASTRKLAFDPIERAGELWREHVGDDVSMRLATSIMRVQQIVLAALDAAVRPYDITFSRYEVLRLISFSKDGRLPMSKIGERLMVHPTSVTSLVDRLEAQELVERTNDPGDRRRIYVSLTPAGRRVLKSATRALTDIDFAVGSLDESHQVEAYELLRRLRSDDFED